MCVVVQGKADSPLTYKIFCVMTIDEEYTICWRFPGRKRYSPLMFRKMERIVGYHSSWFKAYLYVVKGQKRIHVNGKDTHLEFLDF